MLKVRRLQCSATELLCALRIPHSSAFIGTSERLVGLPVLWRPGLSYGLCKDGTQRRCRNVLLGNQRRVPDSGSVHAVAVVESQAIQSTGGMMKRAVVKLEVSVTCEVPDHIVERDMKEQGPHLTEAEIWHDYAVGAIQRSVEVLQGPNKDTDWAAFSVDIFDFELEEGPEDV